VSRTVLVAFRSINVRPNGVSHFAGSVFFNAGCVLYEMTVTSEDDRQPSEIRRRVFWPAVTKTNGAKTERQSTASD
jgi:hypothetical protein